MRWVRVLKRLKRPFAIWPIITAYARAFRGRPTSQIKGGTQVRGWKKPIPAWGMLIFLLLGVGLGFYASTIFGQVAGTGESLNPDFNIGASPPSTVVQQGAIATFVISLDSLNSFAGSVNLNVTVSPMINSTLGLNPGSVSLFTGTASATLTIPIPPSARIGTYTIQIGGTSGRLSHGVVAILGITVPASPDFQLQANPFSMNITQGAGGTGSITVTSVGGFAGIVNLTASISPSSSSSPGASLTPGRVTLFSGGTASVVLTISSSGATARGAYSIIIQGVSGNLSNTVTVPLRIQ